MEEMKELNANEMENVSGGVWRTVDTGIEGLNAALRSERNAGGHGYGPGRLRSRIRTQFRGGNGKRQNRMDCRLHCRTAPLNSALKGNNSARNSTRGVLFFRKGIRRSQAFSVSVVSRAFPRLYHLSGL